MVGVLSFFILGLDRVVSEMREGQRLQRVIEKPTGTCCMIPVCTSTGTVHNGPPLKRTFKISSKQQVKFQQQILNFGPK